MNTKVDRYRGVSRFIHADRYACAAFAILLLLTCASAAALASLAWPAVNGLLASTVPQPTPTISTAAPGTNLAYQKPVTVSRALSDFPAAMAVDGNPYSWWGSGSHAPQWIEVDLGGNYVISQIRLLPSQSPEGETTHRLLVKGTLTGNKYVSLHTFKGSTADFKWLSLEFPEPLRGVRYLRIETTSSPSWVSWREIEVIAGE